MSVSDDRFYYRNLQNARNTIADSLIAGALGGLKPLKPLPSRARPAGGPRQEVKALLLDIYGTLLISDSGDIGLLASQRADESALAGLMAAFGLDPDPSGLKNKLRQAIADEHARAREKGNLFPEVVIEKLWQKILHLDDSEAARRFALCWELATNPVWPMPFLRQLIETCVARGISLGIISNAQFYTPLLFKWLLAKDLEGLGFKSDLIFFSYLQRCAKPCPALFAKAVDALEARGIAKKHTLYLGNDMLNDILPAKECGFQAALFAGDRRSLRMRPNDSRLDGIKPDWTVTGLDQVAGAL